MIEVSHYGDRPPEGSTGELIYNALDRACYPWENFWVTRSDCGGWTIKFYSAQYNERFHQNVIVTDEMLNCYQGDISDLMVRFLHDLRMYITKYALEHRYERKEGNP